MEKIKIINDPVYGFIKIPGDIIFRLIGHPYFQRLRRIKQLGLTHLVYPGAQHTRFHHALGALHLMGVAVESLKAKGVEISPDEAEAVSIAILLHDIGHGPFSHALEKVFVEGLAHEEISVQFMNRMNDEFGSALTTAIAIFEDKYPKKFLHQLVSSQLDIDRLDYLRRDSFFTGVYEGTIGSDRIINMMNVKGDALVIEAKGVYSIEKFLLARRFMYWQVYLHKTSVSAEQLLLKIMIRAKELAAQGVGLFCTSAFRYFLYNKIDKKAFISDTKALDTFALLDDYDIFAAIKEWMGHSDYILSALCKKMINRDLFKIELQPVRLSKEKIENMREKVSGKYNIPENLAHYFVFSGAVENRAYSTASINISILKNDDSVVDISKVSGLYELSGLTTSERKYFICYPKDL